MTRIESGSGTGNTAKVNSEFRLEVESVTTDSHEHAAVEARAFNINTGVVSISAETAILYIKNNEDRDLFISAIALGVGGGTFTATGFGTITIIKNPTTGTCISGATPVAMNENINYGSSTALTADAYVGASGETFTNGTDVALLATANAQSRVFATLNQLLQKGNSIGIKFDPNLSSGSTNVYAAAICHLEEKL